MEGDDHDFNEIRYINLINDKNELQKFEYDSEIPEDEDRGSVGFLKINETIETFFNQIKNNLRNTEFTPVLLSRLEEIYSKDKSLKQAFRELIFWLFDKYGLIIFDPQDREIKSLMKPVFKKELTNFRQHTEKLVSTSAKLDDDYHAQVKIRPVNLFYSTDGGRFLIDPVDGAFRLRKKRKKYSYDELISLIETEPENFSANVLLRPICQDYILPTAFYIGGPSEIAYFAQATPLYDYFNIVIPIIYPRPSVSLVEKNVASVISKYNLNITQVFWEPDRLKEHVLSTLSDITIDTIFNGTGNKINIALDQLKESLFEFDKTISDASTKYRQKILNYLMELKGKAISVQKTKHETTLRQVDKISSSLFPNSFLQERELNFIYFMNKYGMDFLDKLMDEIEINKFEHQVINL